ncbi:hypothetical protein [Marinobacter sp. F4218]|uniref:hypothetical protein n=1 Tax=Marinobacter sp. F4218 TaxID=2862868 RepID=UPI001C62D169|nr:hypothetical protein [Marinobacter sp. F4218]MBW7469685.1 hypothetical protein [Marinobacter sp. F4218]
MGSKNLRYSIISAIAFSIAGASALLLTDLVVVPRAPGIPISFYYSSNLILLVSVSFVPACVAYLTSYFWLSRNITFFDGWLSVAAFSWLSLLINPAVWLLVLSSFLFFGFTVLAIFFITGLLLEFTIGQPAGNNS